MSVHADLLIDLAVVAALWAIYVIRKHRREASKPRWEMPMRMKATWLSQPSGHKQPWQAQLPFVTQR